MNGERFLSKENEALEWPSDILNHCIVGDARSVLRRIPDKAVHCIITSPPYWQQRVYEVPSLIWGGDMNCQHEWESCGFLRTNANLDHPGPDGRRTRGQEAFTKNTSYVLHFGDICKCGAWKGQLGLEPTPEMYINHLLEVFSEALRVLRTDGVFWLNLADSYAGSNQGRGTKQMTPLQDHNVGTRWMTEAPSVRLPEGTKPKDIIGIPWAIAFALRAQGWYWRQWIPWLKLNPMTESVRDRPADSLEVVHLLTKSRRNYFDMFAAKAHFGISRSWRSGDMLLFIDTYSERSEVKHYATFPTDFTSLLTEVGSSPKACPRCGTAWVRSIENPRIPQELRRGVKKTDYHPQYYGSGGNIQRWRDANPPIIKDWVPSCRCSDNSGAGKCIILDPFGGTGTVAVAAQKLGRDFVSIDLSGTYSNAAALRVRNQAVQMELEI